MGNRLIKKKDKKKEEDGDGLLDLANGHQENFNEEIIGKKRP